MRGINKSSIFEDDQDRAQFPDIVNGGNVKKLITILTALMLVILFSSSCQKAKGPEEKKEAQLQKEENKQSIPEKALSQAEQQIYESQRNEKKTTEAKENLLTEEEQNSFKGGWIEAGNVNQKDAIQYLRILIKGSPQTIQWYRQHEGDEGFGVYKESKLLYQVDICSMVEISAKEKNPEAFGLILQVIEKKAVYSKARACAAETIGWYGKFKNGKWYGDKRSISVLKDILNDKDSEVRLQAAGTLLSLGEADIALPILDELAKAGIHQSTFALDKLFAPEEREVGGVKRVVVSHIKLWDERGKEILIKALKYSSDEVKAFAAVRLAEMGEQKLAEPVLLDILKRLKDMRRKDYGLTEEDYKKYGKGGKEAVYENYISDSVALGNTINALKSLKSRKAIPLLKDVINNSELTYEKNWAMEAIKNSEGK